MMDGAVHLRTAVALILCAAAHPTNAQIDTLSTVKQRGFLHCGVNIGLPGFSQSDGAGNWRGLDVDYCKAIAAAVLGNHRNVTYVPIPGITERFSALQSGAIDVLLRNTTWTSGRDATGSFSFVGVNYYDGQSLMVKASRAAQSVKDLDGRAVCVRSGTTSEANLADYFQSRQLSYKPVKFESHEEALQAYLADRCDAYTADASALYSDKVQQARPKDHVMLPEIISKEPLGPSVRRNDSQWFTIIRWVHFALINAEELGVTQVNADQMLESPIAGIRRLLGKEGNFGIGLGLDNDFALKMVKAVGNYGEIFERNVGSGSRLKIERGLNNLWSKGGLHYAPPIQ
jgi:general L-amino acid transport system substrate-binding protein